MRSRVTFLGVASLAATCVLSATTALAADIAVVTAEDLGWRHPQSSEDHRVVVMERFRNNACTGCTFPRFHDVGVLDLGATCAQEVLRLVTSDGLSHDPSVSADGATLAFWREETTGGFSVVVQALDGSGTPIVFTESSPDEIGNLDLSPGGRYVTWWRRTGTTEEVVILDSQAVPPAIVASDWAADVIVGDQRPIDATGNVVYSKLVGAVHELHRLTPAGVVTSLDVADVEELEASVSADGTVVAFVGVETGFQNVWAGTTRLTFNTSASLDMAAVAVSSDGTWVAFHSEADLIGGNADQTWEVFRATPDGLTLEQVTSITPPGPFGDVLLDRVTTSNDGEVLFWGQTTCLGPCTVVAANELAIRVASLSVTTPPATAVTEVVRPPFDVVTDVGGVTPAPGCSVVGRTVTCAAVIRASPDAARDLLVQPEWTLDGEGGACPDQVITGEPVVLGLGAGLQTVVGDAITPTCTPTSVTFRVRAVGGELDGQPDFSLLTEPSISLP